MLLNKRKDDTTPNWNEIRPLAVPSLLEKIASSLLLPSL